MRYVFNPITCELDLVETSGGTPVTITASLTKTAQNSIEYKGFEIPNTLTWKTLKNGSPVTPASVRISKVEGDGAEQILEDLSSPSSNTGTCNAPISFLGKTTFKAVFTVSGQSKTASVSVTTYLPMYIGFDPGNHSPLNEIKDQLQTFDKNDIPFILDGTDGVFKQLVIAVPDGTRIKSVHSDMNFPIPLENPMEDVVTLNGNDHGYTVYRSFSNIDGDVEITNIIFE